MPQTIVRQVRTVSREEQGWERQILLTGQVLNVLRWYIREEHWTTMIRSVRVTEEEKYGYHGCSTVIIFPCIAIDYMYPVLSNRTRSQIPRRGRFINESAIPRNADKLSIKKEQHTLTPMPSWQPFHSSLASIILWVLYFKMMYATWYEIYSTNILIWNIISVTFSLLSYNIKYYAKLICSISTSN